MRALPLTNTTRPGGRPRQSRAPRNAFADWLQTCGMSPEKIVESLKKKGVKVSTSSIYNARNGWFTPGRRLANAIAELSTDKDGNIAVPTTSWDNVKSRQRVSATPTVESKPKKRAKRPPEAA